jgi:hypothetical protein
MQSRDRFDKFTERARRVIQLIEHDQEHRQEG